MSTPKSKRKQHPHRQSTKKSRKQPSRHEILTSPANEVQNLLAKLEVKVVTKRGLGLNDYGFQRNASKSIYPYSQIMLAPSNAIQYLERSKWSKSIQLLDFCNSLIFFNKSILTSQESSLSLESIILGTTTLLMQLLNSVLNESLNILKSDGIIYFPVSDNVILSSSSVLIIFLFC
jgi:hypothetical protein